MTFEDLPPNYDDLALTDETLAGDVIDLIVSGRDRASGCFAVMMCDDQHRGLQPVIVHDIPGDDDGHGIAVFLDKLMHLLIQSGGSILLARGRPRGSRPNDLDRAWHQRAIDTASGHGVPLLGFYLATRDGVFRLPDPLEAVA